MVIFALCGKSSFPEQASQRVYGDKDAEFSIEFKAAQKTQHSTAHQAATIAQKCEAKHLIIGHFSNRYADLNLLLNESKKVFSNTEIAEQGKVFKVGNPQ